MGQASKIYVAQDTNKIYRYSGSTYVEISPLEAHTHGNITNDGRVGTTADKPLITGTGGAVVRGANSLCVTYF